MVAIVTVGFVDPGPVKATKRTSRESSMASAAFDDRDGLIWFDGQWVDWRSAKVHVLTHAMHYASAVFEGERAYGGRIFKSREHSERLRESARILDFEIPYNAAQIDAAKAEVLARNGLAD